MADDTTTWPALDDTTVAILANIARGKTMEAASIRLGIPLGRAKRLIRDALDAWSVPNRTALVHLACNRGVLALDLPPVEAERGLTAAQFHIVVRLAEGYTYEQIARRAYLSDETVKTHVKRALQARRAATSAQLVYLLHQDGLLAANGATRPLFFPRASQPATRRRDARTGPVACGTWQGYDRHLYHGQKPCRPCSVAKNALSTVGAVRSGRRKAVRVPFPLLAELLRYAPPDLVACVEEELPPGTLQAAHVALALVEDAEEVPCA